MKTPVPAKTILVTGARGFIGRHCVEVLGRAGHRVICGVRSPSHDSFPRQGAQGRCREMVVDFGKDFSVRTWIERLAGVDVVINTVGAMVPRRGETLKAIHASAPRALFDACVALGVKAV